MSDSLDAVLGRVAAPPHAMPFEGVRIAMLDRLVTDGAGGDAGHEAWRGAWEQAAARMGDEVISQARAALDAAGRHSRYPARRLAALAPDAETIEILRNRLLAEGIPFEALESAPAAPEFTRRRGAALEQAWDGAVRVASGDLARWHGVAAQVAAWKRPMRAFWIGAALGMVAVATVAAWLGGQLPAPGWFSPLASWWWSLPWP